ncbi:MAG: hypothetical protein IRZ32_02500 [Solirubrobacteraceae bacterium]|nr:hypothetical protein [Solirubrobacteraceae bacterium]
MKLRRVLALTAVSAFALPLAACGNKQEVVTHGHTEGSYLNVGGLTYQVQISRQLNPNDVTDRSYLVQVPEFERELGPDESWFAVFVTAFNESDEAHPSATEFEIVDTQDTVYRPIQLGEDNVFAYRPAEVEAGEQNPPMNSAAANNPTVNGGLLLFKVKNDSFDNRPLELRIHAAEGTPEEAAVDLDV